MQHDFVINTENVNSYYYRILTGGIDYKQYERNPVVLYLHNREHFGEDRGKEVVGRCVKLRQEGTDLIATIEFDETCSLGLTVSNKVKGGFLKMASMYCTIQETSDDPALTLEGQIYHTVTKSKLIEISIVPIGGNDDALKLSQADGAVKLNKLKIKTENMSELKTIALALNMAPDASESVVLESVKTLQLSKDKSELKVVELQAQIDGIHNTTATELVEKAVVLGLIPAGLKDAQLGAFKNDFEGAKVILSGLIAEKEAANQKEGNQNTIKEVVLGGGKSKEAANVDGDVKDTFDYLQKHDAAKLSQIKQTDPAKYAELAAAYGKGVRFTK